MSRQNQSILGSLWIAHFSSSVPDWYMKFNNTIIISSISSQCFYFAKSLPLGNRKKSSAPKLLDFKENSFEITICRQ
jgi:hypothetical protein